MKIEDIENAAREESGIWAPGPVHLQDIYRRDDFEAGFHRGANWRIDSVWHSNTEIPNRTIDKNYCGEAVLIQTLNGGLNFGIVYYGYGYNGEMCYTVTCLDITYTMDQIKQWAYVKDLIPTED